LGKCGDSLVKLERVLMKRTYKVFLLISNVGLILIGMNIFLKFIPFENSKVNPILILLFCLINILLGLVASIEATNSK
jgi:hypothetical protein